MHLEEVRAAAEDVLAFTAGLDEAGLLALPDADRRTFRALKNALVEIGERVDGLPPDLHARHPGVDWRGWASLCAMVSNRYFGPELNRLHPVIADELPALLAAVETELTQPGTERLDGQAPSPG
jgi:uncharacterized protein with HEPN domain